MTNVVRRFSGIILGFLGAGLFLFGLLGALITFTADALDVFAVVLLFLFTSVGAGVFILARRLYSASAPDAQSDKPSTAMLAIGVLGKVAGGVIGFFFRSWVW